MWTFNGQFNVTAILLSLRALRTSACDSVQCPVKSASPYYTLFFCLLMSCFGVNTLSTQNRPALNQHYFACKIATDMAFAVKIVCVYICLFLREFSFPLKFSQTIPPSFLLIEKASTVSCICNVDMCSEMWTGMWWLGIG